MGEKSDLKETSSELAQVCLLFFLPEFPSDCTSDISIHLMDWCYELQFS